MSEVRVTATGPLTADPEVTQVGTTTKAQFTIATNPSVFRDGEWKKLPPVFTTCEVWGGLAQAVAARFRQGSVVIASGVMRTNEYENREGAKRRFQFLRVEEVGPHIADRTPDHSSHSPATRAETAPGSATGYVAGDEPAGPGWGRPSGDSGTQTGGWGFPS